ncbi:hypothetical protein JVU11DRAFT_4754 [Chiua virens]|nr:hypothetical protein JVU11DRAFT_4754 [Chiua virens]
MEAGWKKHKPLQTGFTTGMENLLGVTEAAKCTAQDVDDDLESDNTSHHSRYDVEEADLQDEVESVNRARQRYQRLFWESVAEGEEPVMPNVLENQRGAASTRTKPGGKKTLVKRAPGRPAIMFVDVGDVFVDKKEKERREREGARRSKVKARNRM